jgi:riboflavin kinase/FMN adenylyltransferase
MTIIGKVVQGNKKARGLGFPTANVFLNEDAEPGIYAGRAEIDGSSYKAALYVGRKNLRLMEAHVLDFEGDLYDKEIELRVCDKIRDEFDTTDDAKLKEMIENDIEMIRIELDNNKTCLPE